MRIEARQPCREGAREPVAPRRNAVAAVSARHGVRVPYAPGCEFVHARVIEAPRAQVFAAIAEPSRVARWWGPEGFSNTMATFEFRQGGRWLFTMHGPDGTDYPNENRFAEISAPGRVVVEHVSDTHHFHLVIGLEARRARTRVTWRQVFDDAAHAAEMAAIVRPANEQNLTRLATEVLRGRAGIRVSPAR